MSKEALRTSENVVQFVLWSTSQASAWFFGKLSPMVYFWLVGMGPPVAQKYILGVQLWQKNKMDALKSLGLGISVLVMLILGQVFQNDHLLSCS